MCRLTFRPDFVSFTILAASTLFLSGLAPASRAATNPVAASSNYVAPGQTVTLRWYFTGQKVTVSGGNFGKGKIVTGKSFLVDRPLKTTRYTFDVWYKPTPPKPAESAPAPAGSAPSSPAKPDGANNGSAPAGEPSSAAPAPAASLQTGLKTAAATQAIKPATKPAKIAPPSAAAPGKLIHAQYSTVVEVLSGMTPYQDTHGWQISYMKGWRVDQQPGQNGSGVTWFQKEMDSVERVAVAVLPGSYAMPEQVMEKVKSDLGTNYNKVETVSLSDLTYADMLAQRLVFTGNDETHPGTKTESLVLTMVRENRAYIISARTTAANFAARRALLESMVRSFAITTPPKGFAQVK